MRLKHNKKRNTAFVYEALVRELTKNIVKNNKAKVNKIVPIMKDYFSRTSVLGRELGVYRSVYETRGMDKKSAEKILIESRHQYEMLDKREIFSQQTDLIKKINKALSPTVFRNFVPNYKNIASVYSIFNADITAKDRVMLENRMVDEMTSSVEPGKPKEEIDNLVYETFVQKFNTKYSDSLSENQRELLNKYISSFIDGGVELKAYLNEEISRLKDVIDSMENMATVSADKTLMEGRLKVKTLLESFASSPMSDEIIEDVLKIQKLTEEVLANDS